MKPTEYGSRNFQETLPTEVPEASSEAEMNDQETEIAEAKEQFDIFLKKVCAMEDDADIILDRLYEAKNDAFHIGKYKLMGMFGEEIRRREVTEEGEEEFEEAAA